MKQKGVYPHDYMDSFKRFSEKKLPNTDNFYSILNDQIHNMCIQLKYERHLS